jgi:Tol biopolymer transport system component
MTFTDPLEEQRNLDNCCFNWSPDGSYLAYKRINREVSNDWQLVIVGNDQPIYINEPKADLFGPTQWSPDGSILAWVGLIPNHSHGQLALTNVVTGRTQVLTLGNGFFVATGIAWAPNGEQIAIRQGDQIQIVNVRPGAVPATLDMIVQKENLALQGDSFAGISWSPDGKFIAYESGWQEDSRVWILEHSTNVNSLLVSQSGN